MRQLATILTLCLWPVACSHVMVGEPAEEVDLGAQDSEQKNLDAVRQMQAEWQRPVTEPLTAPPGTAPISVLPDLSKASSSALSPAEMAPSYIPPTAPLPPNASGSTKPPRIPPARP